MKTYLTAAGIAADRILIEDRSTNTHENLLFSKQILEQQGLPNRITILTDGFHQYRAHRMATELGLESWSVSGKTRRILIPTYWVREWMALFEQFLGMA
ncbi:MAG: YdcF family protein [Ruminococcus sp.]